MSADPVADATVVVVSYNHAEFIEECLRTTLAEAPGEVVVVDPGSTDGTREIVAETFPDVALLTPEENGGYGAGNNVGVGEITTDYTVILNPDTRVEPGAFEALVTPLVDSERLITTPKILTYDGDRINTCGNVDHFTGLGFTRGLHRPPDDFTEPQTISGISGACFALRTELYRELGGFDESFFLYMEDVELSWRAALHDVEIRYVPDAVIYHDFEEVAVPAEKIYHIERGRYYTLRKHLDARTAVTLLPALGLAEVLTTGYAVLKGSSGMRNKLRAVRDGLTVEVDGVEKDPQTVLSRLATEIPADQLSYSKLDQFGKKFANAVFRLNYRLIDA